MAARTAAIAALILAAAWVPNAVAERLDESPVGEVVNGLLTHEAPSVGVLLRVGPGGRFVTNCTATLIGCETVLTAAHCFCGEDLKAGPCVQTGMAETMRQAQIFALQHAGAFAIASVSIHPDYDFPLKGDVAILKLDGRVEGIVPSRINTVREVPLGTTGAIVGFGHSGSGTDSGIKRTGLITTSECRDPRDGKLKDGLICWRFLPPVGPPGEDSSTCHGDSGGPLFVDLGTGPMVGGVTSGVAGACTSSDLAFDADTFRYRTWIAQRGGSDISQDRCGALPPLGQPTSGANGFSGTLSPAVRSATYYVDVPAGADVLRFALNGADGASNDFDLVVRYGSEPTDTQYDCWDDTYGPYGYCEFDRPSPGRWFVAAVHYGGSGTFQISASAFGWDPPASPTYTPTQPRTATPSPSRTATRRTSGPTPSRTPTRRSSPAPGPCFGDCNGDGLVTVNEIVAGVSIALGAAAADSCPGLQSGSGTVTVDQLIRAIASSLNDCRPNT